MTLTIDIRLMPNYVHAVVSGPYESQPIHAAFANILEAAAKNRLPNILIDVRNLIGEPSMAERFELGSFFAAQLFEQLVAGRSTSYKVALVGTAPLIHADLPAISILNQRGGSAIATERVEDALQWLSVEPNQ